MTTKKKVAVMKRTNVALTPLQLIASAVENPDFDIEKLEKLMQLQTRWEEKEAKRAYAKAMVGFQGSCPPIPKSKSFGGSRKITYASLEGVMTVVQPHLLRAGLSISFNTKLAKMEGSAPGYIKVLCKVEHELGHSETSKLIVPVDSQMSANDSQKMGSANSYAKRYALSNALNLVYIDEDDDAQVLIEYINVDQVTVINDLLKESGANEQLFLKWCKSLEVILIPVSKFDACVARLRDLRDIYPQRDKVTT